MMRYAFLDRATGGGTRCGGHRRCHHRLRGGGPAREPAEQRSAPPATAAAPQQLQPSTLVVPDALKGEFDPHQVLSRRAGRCRCGPPCRTPGWRRGRPTARCSCRGPARARSCGSPRRRRHGHLDRPAQRAHPAARPRLRRHHALRRGEQPDPGLHLRGGRGDRPAPGRRRPSRLQVQSAGRPVRARAQERRRRSGPRALLLDRVERQHLGRRPRREAAASLDHADPAGRRSAGGLRPRGAQRHRARRRARRRGLDGGEQPRQHRVPVRRALRGRAGVVAGRGDRRLRERPPRRGAGQAHARAATWAGRTATPTRTSDRGWRAPRSSTPTRRSSTTSRPTPAA